MERRTDEVLAAGFTDHVLVCTTDREEHACCGADGEAVLAAAREWLRERGVLWSRVHLAETSCLGLCGDGAGVAVHPRGEWYAGVTAGDVPELLAAEFGPGAERLGVDG